MLTLSVTSKAEFLASLERLTAAAVTIPYKEMTSAIQSVPENDFTAAEWHKVVQFSVDQIGQWQVKWLFSSAQTPDTQAHTESDAWELLWDGFLKALVDQVPGIEEKLRKAKDLLIAQRLLQQKVQQDGDNRVALFSTSTMSRFAIALNRFGCRGIAQWLYIRALFPSGSVGRIRGS